MIPQGSVVLNVAYFEGIKSRIETASTCAELNALAAEAVASVSAVSGAIAEQFEKIAPILDLLEIPATNPAAIISWITKFVGSFLTPYVQPYYNLASQVALLQAQLASLIEAIEHAKLALPSCSFDLPTVEFPSIP